jgi:hypothetical protein
MWSFICTVNLICEYVCVCVYFMSVICYHVQVIVICLLAAGGIKLETIWKLICFAAQDIQLWLFLHCSDVLRLFWIYVGPGLDNLCFISLYSHSGNVLLFENCLFVTFKFINSAYNTNGKINYILK